MKGMQAEPAGFHQRPVGGGEPAHIGGQGGRTICQLACTFYNQFEQGLPDSPASFIRQSIQVKGQATLSSAVENSVAA
ncbi:hypothetical protein SDC9_124923 [bioreactor metagenome]|uniref:Uncharacterized protein n=1 Tax=bioreactor metagenome TaxID=1076179 RepID=A0A645CM02_9ZZZZ